MSLLVVGSVAYDGIETPLGKTDRTLGGSATYISLASSYFASPIRLVGTVGNDFDDQDIELLKKHDIDLEGFKVDNSGKTFFWKGKYHQDMNSRDTLDTQLNVFEKFDPIIPDSYKKSRIVCLGNIEPSLQSKVLKQVDSPELTILDTMNFWISGAKEKLVEAVSQVDVLIVNDEEARELSGEINLLNCADAIRAMGPKILIIKKGEHGALLYSDAGVFSAPAYPMERIFDPTGAGDSFMGGFSGWLDSTNDLSEKNIRRAVIMGSVMASFCVEKFGTERLRELSKEQITERYNEFKKMSVVPGIQV
ncbi:MAG: PfkB family carbohydrate kinase [Balneolales bacterium]